MFSSYFYAEPLHLSRVSSLCSVPFTRIWPVTLIHGDGKLSLFAPPADLRRVSVGREAESLS